MPARLAAVELGGTSIRVAIAEGEVSNIVARESFACDVPDATLGKVRAWLADHSFDALGVASFGPIEPRRWQPKYGFITSTPKPGWGDVDVLGGLGAYALRVPVAFDTDVNAPAVSEFRAAQAAQPLLTSCAYVTVGTGVGVGLVVNGKPVHGMLHPEAGHCPAPRAPGDEWECTLGLRIPTGIEANVSAPALASRAGVSQSELAQLDDDHPMWDHAAHYLAVLCVDLVLIASVERIVLGGGVMARRCLYNKVRARFRALLNGYLQLDELSEQSIGSYIVPPAHGADAGLIGALTLARDALHEASADRRRARELVLRAAGVGALVVAALLVGVRLGRRS
jgi:fructokinase